MLNGDRVQRLILSKHPSPRAICSRSTVRSLTRTCAYPTCQLASQLYFRFRGLFFTLPFKLLVLRSIEEEGGE
jgi:CRISPR/Cas system endoribonuclease Cas6 (RAMP superfamily)